MRRVVRRLLLAASGPLLLVPALLGAVELLLQFAPDRRPCFLVRTGSGRDARFERSGRAPTVSSKLRTPSFTVEPPDGTDRVLMVGDSTMYGLPFEPPVPFADWVAQRLPMLLPGRRFEVVNLGASGMCSEDVLDLLRECGGAGASLIVVYVGHNEFLDANLPRLLSPRRRAIERTLQTTRLGSLLLDATRGPPRSIAADVVNRRVLIHDEPMIPPDAIERGLAAYRRHLEAMVALGRSTGARVALFRPLSDAFTLKPHLSCFSAVTPASARSRFTAEVQAIDTERRKLEATEAAAGGGEADRAAIDALLVRCDALATLDASVALLPWERGRLLLLKGEREAAATALQEALALDGYPWRQLPRAAEIVEDVAARSGAILVDARPLFDAESAPLLPDQRCCFVDDVHPSARGHELLAEALLRSLAAAGWCAPSDGWRFDLEPSLDDYRRKSGFSADAEAAALARSAFMLLGESHFDRAARPALKAAQRKLEMALEADAGSAEAHLGLAVLAAIRGDSDAAMTEIEIARRRDATIDRLLEEPVETVPAMRAAFEAAGLELVDGRLEKRR